MDALKPCHSGCPPTSSCSVTLTSLAHHHRVFKRGLPHLAFRRGYLACLRVFVSQATAFARCDMASPVPPSSVSARHARSSEVESESPRKTRRVRRRMRPTRVRDEPVGASIPTDPIWIRRMDYIYTTLGFSSMLGRLSQPHTADYWLHHMGRDQAISAALQLQRDAGLIMPNLQVLRQFVTSLNRMSSEVMRLAFGHEPYPSEAVQSVAPSPRVQRVAHYMAVMGLWRPPGSQGDPGPLPTSSCNTCMMCADCFPDLRK